MARPRSGASLNTDPTCSCIETLIVIRELSPETHVIMISGKADESEARRALALGAFDYLTKPFDLTYFHQVWTCPGFVDTVVNSSMLAVDAAARTRGD